MQKVGRKLCIGACRERESVCVCGEGSFEGSDGEGGLMYVYVRPTYVDKVWGRGIIWT